MSDTPTASLLISCPDRPGIAAAVTSFLYERSANIVHADQHVDVQAGIFFQRLEFDGVPMNPTSLRDDFAGVATAFDMDFTIRLSSDRPKVAILCSRQGHCLYDLLARWSLGELPCELALVASNHLDHQAAVERSGVAFHHVPVNRDHEQEQHHALLDLLAEEQIELVIMARYMQILPESIVSAFPNRIINIHHSFLPAFPGGRPYHQAHARGVKLIGATAHYATLDLDEGPIIEQDVSRVTHRHGPTDLVSRGRDLEMLVLARAVKAHLKHQVLVYDNKTVVFG